MKGQDPDQATGPPTAREGRELRALAHRKHRVEAGRFLSEGIRVVEELLASTVPVHWVATTSTLVDSERGAGLVREIERRGIVRRVLAERDLIRFAATESPQGVIAVAETPTPALDDLQVGTGASVVLVLDAVQDPGNVGTLIRSAEAFAAAGVVVLPGTVDPWNPKCVRAAAGSSFRVPIVPATWAGARAALKDRGFQLLGAARDGPPLPQRGDRIALVLGNEGAGLSAAVRAEADALVGIPLPGRAESLNVAAAAAILLYEATR